MHFASFVIAVAITGVDASRESSSDDSWAPVREGPKKVRDGPKKVRDDPKKFNKPPTWTDAAFQVIEDKSADLGDPKGGDVFDAFSEKVAAEVEAAVPDSGLRVGSEIDAVGLKKAEAQAQKEALAAKEADAQVKAKADADAGAKAQAAPKAKRKAKSGADDAKKRATFKKLPTPPAKPKAKRKHARDANKEGAEVHDATAVRKETEN